MDLLKGISKVILQKSKALDGIIATYTTKDVVIESVNQMLNQKEVDASSSQVSFRDTGKYVETLGEDVVSSDESIFFGCSINIRVDTVSNKDTKSIMGFTKAFFNDFQIEVEDVKDDV